MSEPSPMIEPPTHVDVEPELAAVVRLTIPRAEMQSAFPKAVHEILDALKEQGKSPAGPPFAYHFRFDPDEFDFEIGFPTAEPVTPVGRVRPGELPAARAVRTVYRGPYEGLPGAWKAFQAWIEGEEVEVEGPFWERYVLGPEATEDPKEYRTELNRVVPRTPTEHKIMRTNVRKITPILYVEEIEPVLPFWTERLGFELATQVPEGDRLGFVILTRDGFEVMYQTRASVGADVPSLAATPMKGSILFIEIENLDDVEAALEGVERVVPRRKTFYGSEEIFVREPAGNVIGFAQFGSDEE